MKNLDFKKCGLQQLSLKEKKEKNGGFIWFFNWTVIRDSDFDYCSDVA